MNAAMAEDRFVAYQQRCLALSAAADGGCHREVLLRRVDADGALIPPGRFLPAAERYNLMPAIDRWGGGAGSSPAIAVWRRHKALGFLFALDDFGTGMRSYGYLKNLPVDDLIRRMGVDCAQGFGVCKPTPMLEASAEPTAASPSRVVEGRSAATMAGGEAAGRPWPERAGG